MKEEKAIRVDFSELVSVLNKLVSERKQDNEKWELTIRSEFNCYILIGDIEGVKRTWTIEEDENDDLKMHERLLWEVIEFFQMQGSRYDKERLTIVRKMGDKYVKPLHARDIKGDV